MTSTARLSLAMILVGAPLVAQATPTSLPYSDSLGSTTSSGCAAAWDGDCVVGWDGHGDNDSLKVVTEGSRDGVRIRPGSALPNGMDQVFDVSGHAGDWLYTTFFGWTQNGTASLHVRAVFKNSGGVTIDTETDSTGVATCSSPADLIKFAFEVPANAVTATVFIGVGNGSGTDPDVEVVAGMGIPPILIFLEGDSPGECPAPDCNPDISCEEEGYAPFCVCDGGNYPQCEESVDCWCEEIVAEEFQCPWE